MIKNKYIIMNNIGISGAEKRMISIWKELVVMNNQVYLVINRIDYKKILINNEFNIQENHKKNIIIFDLKKYSFFSFFLAIFKIRKKFKKNSIFHFPLIYSPLFLIFRGNKIIVSWNANFRPIKENLPLKLLGLIWFSFLLSYKIDVLNLKNYTFIKNYFNLKNKIYHNKGGSFTNFAIYKPAKKENIIVLMSRLIEGKGIFEFINTLPTLFVLLNKNNIEIPKIFICGDGKLKKNILKKIKSSKLAKFEIKLLYSEKPYEILSKAKIFVSMQKFSNYPSKSLIEAMSCGCIPIITDNGDSREMANEKDAKFINPNIDEIEVSQSIIDILKMSESDFNNKSKNIRKNTMFKFDIQNSIDYYNDLYN